MKAQIRDGKALEAISPVALLAFARGEGWVRTGVYGASADVYTATNRPDIIIPRTDRLGDYASVVSQLLDIFAQATGRDELATYRDLVGVDRDVVRVRASGAEDDGSISLDSGVAVVERSRDMLLAAACAAQSRQAFYRAGANKDAIDYMRRVRLGQTEHGSFVITLLAPVPPSLQPLQLPLDPAWAALDEEPMERQVTRRLVMALKASRSAAEQALSGDGEAFDRAVGAGVSANLCEAVAGLIEQANGIDVSLTWARTRPAPEAQSRVTFSRSDAEILKEAAHRFRRRQPRTDVTLHGTITRLKRDQDDLFGDVTLKAIIDDRLQAVRAVFDPANYSTVLQAHDSKAPMIFTGDLERIGQRWQLTKAGVRPLPTEDADDEP